VPRVDRIPREEARLKYGRLQRLGRPAAGALGVGGVAWFFGGFTALIAAVAGLVIARWLGPRWVAAAAFGSLLVAAVATVVEMKLTQSYNLSFADERPIATHSALVAGALAFVAVAVFAARQGAHNASPSFTGSGEIDQSGSRAARSSESR
jgi:hypothetical protein